MTTLLLETTRDITTRYDAELNREELRRRKGERLQRQILSALVYSADVMAGATLSAWKWVRETLAGEGFEGRELARYCQVLLSGIDLSLTGYERLLAWAEEAGLTPEAAGLRDLEAKLPTLREARPKVTEALALATRALRPIDEKAVADSQAALEREEFVTIDDDYLARVRAGQDF